MSSEVTARVREPVVSPALTVRAVINKSAGTALDLSEDAVRSALESAFATKGHALTVVFADPAVIEDEIDKAATSGADWVIVGGGDGTVRTAARRLLHSDTALGILPLGTLNRLARDLEIPLGLDEAAAALANATPARIDVACVNGSIFLCNSLMGATLRFSLGRARLRGRPASERLPKYLSLVRDVLSNRRKISIVVDDGTERTRLRALSVAVTNNGYDEDTPWLKRSRLDQGRLTMYLSQHRSGWGLVMALIRALLGRWSGDPAMTKLVGTRFVVHAPKRRRRLSNDGEIAKFDTPLVYEVLPKSLTVLMPAPEGRVGVSSISASA